MDKKFYPTIGLEIHAELKTQTKMFCGCLNPAGKSLTSNGASNPEIKPNTLICPVCMAHPGTLPVANKKAIENVIKVGLALDGEIADFTEFDRKNYFYPDIPKGFQISQYKYPIVSGGHLADFDITRVHLEEDTANNKHIEGDPRHGGAGFSLIDFNRAGVPLMELVTEPKTFDASDEVVAKSAAKFAKELQLILWYLGVSDANMEKGEMRVEANISISDASPVDGLRPRDLKKLGLNQSEGLVGRTYGKYVLGTKVEVKNLNSFKSVEKAIKFELDRMLKLWQEGKQAEIVQETRGWDENKQSTFSQRKKESSHDYRYFPEPDLPKMFLHGGFSAKGGPASGWDLEKMKSELPELPEVRRNRYKTDFGIKDEDIESYINDFELGAWFEKVAEILKDKPARS
ncbi:MAG: Asp-tRNA(Asn)/Glu-tRNA(Gln) amidotransferase subunit GatB, partial [Patescibacteria group bacterium]